MAKCRIDQEEQFASRTSSKTHIKLNRRGTLRQVFIRVYRREIQSVMLVFSTQLCELLLPLPLSFNSPPPCVNKHTASTYTVCKRGGGVGSGPGTQTDKNLPQSPFTGELLVTTFCNTFFGSYVPWARFQRFVNLGRAWSLLLAMLLFLFLSRFKGGRVYI